VVGRASREEAHEQFGQIVESPLDQFAYVGIIEVRRQQRGTRSQLTRRMWRLVNGGQYTLQRWFGTTEDALQ